MKTIAPLVIVLAAVVSLPTAASADERAGDLEDSSGHFRIDVDRFGLQAWALAQFPVSDDVAIAGNIYATQPDGPGLPADDGVVVDPFWRPESRVDAGVIFRLGVFELFPKIGFAMDFTRTEAVSLVPQLLAIVRGGPFHFETWNQLFLNAMFQSGAGIADVYYARDQFLVSAWNFIGFGFQMELTLAVRNAPADALLSMPIGGTIQLQPTTSDVIQIFIAGETVELARNGGPGMAGRLTYLHTL